MQIKITGNISRKGIMNDPEMIVVEIGSETDKPGDVAKEYKKVEKEIKEA